MKHLLLIFAGGGLGSVVRFLFSKWVSGLHQLNFPFGTLAVNVVACFFLGLVVGLSDHRQLLSADSKI
jgi:fluoride exporter